MNQEGYTKGNYYELDGRYGVGHTRKGEKFIFDIEDYDKIKGYRWCFDRENYLVAFSRDEGRRKIVKFHQVIMGKAPISEIQRGY